jgi:hypothetical protein
MRMERPVLDLDPERGDAHGQQTLQVTELRRAGRDADPQDAWRATRRKHTHTIKDHLEGRSIDVATERVDNGGRTGVVDVSQEEQREMRVLGPDPAERSSAKRGRDPLLLNRDLPPCVL